MGGGDLKNQLSIKLTLCGSLLFYFFPGFANSDILSFLSHMFHILLQVLLIEKINSIKMYIHHLYGFHNQCMFVNTLFDWPRKSLNFQWFLLILAKIKNSMGPSPDHIRELVALLKCLH